MGEFIETTLFQIVKRILAILALCGLALVGGWLLDWLTPLTFSQGVAIAALFFFSTFFFTQLDPPLRVFPAFLSVCVTGGGLSILILLVAWLTAWLTPLDAWEAALLATTATIVLNYPVMRRINMAVDEIERAGEEDSVDGVVDTDVVSTLSAEDLRALLRLMEAPRNLGEAPPKRRRKSKPIDSSSSHA